MEVKTYTTIFDKAKAAYGTGAYDDATLEFLFPEIKLSEDERMLRALISGFENWKSNGNLTFNLTDVDDILAYLERQKSVEYLSEEKVFGIMNELTNLSYSERIPINSDEYRRIHKITQDVRSLLDYPIEQKEQKPRDYRKLYEEVVNSEWFKKNYVGKSLGEEDEQKEQKPVEWSEEDEKKINFLSRLIEFQVKDDEYCFGDGRLISKQEAIEMLKSLRPVSKDSLQSWKPSEEQMEALERASTNKYLSAKQYDILVSLYEQLNKL